MPLVSPITLNTPTTIDIASELTMVVAYFEPGFGTLGGALIGECSHVFCYYCRFSDSHFRLFTDVTLSLACCLVYFPLAPTTV